MHDPDSSPLNPIPPVITALVVLIGGLELIFSAGARGLVGGANAVGWRLNAMEGYAFLPQVFDWMMANGRYPPGEMVRFASYVFIHGGFTHAIFAIVFLLALGKMVAELFSTWAVLVVFFGSAIMGALAYGLLLDDPRPLIGAFPAVYGLIGAYSFILWVSYGAMGENQYRAFTLIAALLGIQLLFGLLFGGSNDWVADLAGFVTGFLLSFVVSPGGWSRVVAKLRQR